LDGEDEASALLLELAQALHLVAVPADLLEERLRAAAAGLGLSAEVFTLQSLVMVELQAGTGPRRLEMRRIPFDPHWNLRRIADTVELTRAVAERRVGAAAARAELARITARPNRYPKWLVVLGYGAYGAATATRVGGGWREMVPAVLIGFLAGWIHFGTLRSDKVDLLKSFLAALAGTFAGFALGFALPPFDAGKAVFGGVTLLVPAMVIAIGMHELASEALESGVPRLAYGLLRFLMLGFGIGAALAIATAIAPMPAHPAAAGLPPALKLAVVAAGGLALVVCLQGRPRDVPWIIAAVVLAYGVQELTKLAVGSRGSPVTSPPP
jgi:uncharacterized membrane protein YjjP (DUF1212 family)